MPQDLQQLAGYMRQSYSEATQWWEFTSSPALQEAALPEDLLDEVVATGAPDNGTDDVAGDEAVP